MEQYNKIQINGSVKTDNLGNILERSTLVNVRTDDVFEAVQLFNQLTLKMKGQGNIKANPEKITAGDIFPDEEEKCPDCGNKLIQRKNRDGDFFYGCKSYPNCKFTKAV